MKTQKNVMSNVKEITAEEMKMNTAKEILAEFFVDQQVYQNNSKAIEELFEKKRIGVLFDDLRAVMIFDVTCRDKENYLKWYTVAVIFDREKSQIMDFRVFTAEKYSEVSGYVSGYLKCECKEIRTICINKDSNAPFDMIGNIICMRKTSEVLINLNISDSNVENDFIHFVEKAASDESIKTVNGTELSTKDSNTNVADYIFIDKEKAVKIAKSLEYDPKTLFRKMYERGMVYKTKDNRFDKSITDSKIIEKVGFSKLFGIKRDLFIKLKEKHGNEK